MPSRQLREVVVVGAGVAGTRAAETLRQDGYDGALTIVGAERHAPYHRPPLSKKLLTGKVHRAGIDLAPQMEVQVRVLRGASAIKLDLSSRIVYLRDENEDVSLQFDGLVIASGATPREWPGSPVPGWGADAPHRRGLPGHSGTPRLAPPSGRGRRRLHWRRGGRELPIAGPGGRAHRKGHQPVARGPGHGTGASLGRFTPPARRGRKGQRGRRRIRRQRAGARRFG